MKVFSTYALKGHKNSSPCNQAQMIDTAITPLDLRRLQTKPRCRIRSHESRNAGIPGHKVNEFICVLFQSEITSYIRCNNAREKSAMFSRQVFHENVGISHWLLVQDNKTFLWVLENVGRLLIHFLSILCADFIFYLTNYSYWKNRTVFCTPNIIFLIFSNKFFSIDY